ncbi:MAG: VWA domain-containing protein [Acidobacteriia bacterium]|nr:VWA domain-containing protein [Terriglobia bacterium]
MRRLAASLLGGVALLVAQEGLDSRLVDLNVVAVNSQGEPVADLTQDDFRVTDSGKQQKIVFFRHQDSRRWEAPKLQPGEFSNRTLPNAPRATLILFDLMNEDFSSRGVAASQLVRNLESLENADYVYLYLLTLDGKLDPVRALPDATTNVPAAGGKPWTRQAKPLLDQAMRAVMQVRRTDIDVAIRTQITYQALGALAVQLSRIPGRKNVVWITDGVPIELGPNRSDTGDYVDFTPLLRQMSEALDRSDVSIYPVRQVMLGSPDNVDQGRSGIGSLDTLNLFAGMTGGRPDSGKDIGAAVRQAVHDVVTSYQIGYYPPDKEWDNKFHKLKIACTRKGVRLQAKTGYYAWQEPPGAKAQSAISSAMQTAFDAAEIGLRGTLSPAPKGGTAFHLDAHLDAKDIVLVHEGNQYNAQLRLAIVGYGPGGPPQGGPMIPLDLHYSAQDRDQALAHGIDFQQDVTLIAGAKAARFIVFDRNSNAIASVTMPVPEVQPSPAR